MNSNKDSTYPRLSDTGASVPLGVIVVIVVGCPPTAVVVIVVTIDGRSLEGDRPMVEREKALMEKLDDRLDNDDEASDVEETIGVLLLGDFVVETVEAAAVVVVVLSVLVARLLAGCVERAVNLLDVVDGVLAVDGTPELCTEVPVEPLVEVDEIFDVDAALELCTEVPTERFAEVVDATDDVVPVLELVTEKLVDPPPVVVTELDTTGAEVEVELKPLEVVVCELDVSVELEPVVDVDPVVVGTTALFHVRHQVRTHECRVRGRVAGVTEISLKA